jgi:F0F1-type ATP synthase assembly protein I
VRQEPSPIDRDDVRAAGVAAGLGCSIVVSLILFIGGGVFLDRWLDTEPIFILIGVGLGLIVAGYQLYELTQVGRKGSKAGPVSRGIGRVARRGGSGQAKERGSRG